MGATSTTVVLTKELIGLLDDLLVGYDWRADYASRSARGDKTAYAFVVKRAVEHLRDPSTPGNDPAQGRRQRDAGRGIPTSVEPAVARLGTVRDARKASKTSARGAVL